MKLFAALLLVLALTGCANLRQSAHVATGVDAATTAYGVSAGVASELNPLISNPAAFAALMLARVGLTEYVNTTPEPQRTANLGALNSVWWGVSISNFVILALHSTPLGLVIGAGSGWYIWNSTEERRLFAAYCAQGRESNPKLVCEHNGAPL